MFSALIKGQIMKTFFLKNNNSKHLLLFFTGWSTDENILKNDIEASDEIKYQDFDICVCSDYSDLNFDDSALLKYEDIFLVAWSMGVWAASYLLQNKKLNFSGKIAINGTPYLIDDKKGIPEQIFNGTASTLSSVNLEKFYRRMCGRQLASYFLEHHRPDRNIDSFANELFNVGKLSSENKTPDFNWDMAIIGKNDLIFPYENQKNAWRNTKNFITDDAHFAKWLSSVKYLIDLYSNISTH